MGFSKDNSAQTIKETLSVEQVIDFVENELGSNGHKEDAEGNPIFQTIDHNPPGSGSYKLYYYQDAHFFVSYTGDGTPMDIFELTRQAKDLPSFKEAFQTVCSFFHLKPARNLLPIESPDLTQDWTILNKVSDYVPCDSLKQDYPILSPAVLAPYSSQLPLEWIQEGISVAALQRFGIRTYPAMSKIVIPHYDIDGYLVGVRGRSFDAEELALGMKYAPLWSEGVCYRHELGKHLYGLHLVKDTVTRLGKVCIAEGEKSALLSYTYYGDDSFTVATCGSAPLSEAQIALLLQLGCKEIILAYDKENDDDNSSEKSHKYFNKLLKIATPLATLFDVSIVYDNQGLLRAKDSPFDRGKEVLETLLRQKIFAASATSEEAGRKRNRL